VKGAETKAKRSDLGSALDQISGWITSVFQVAQPARSADIASRGKLSKNNNLPYISIGYGGESVSQSPLKDQAFSTFLDQNPPFELPPENGISPPIFSWNPSWLIQILANPSISVGGGQQGWLAFALRRQRSHVRIVSGAPVFISRYLRSERNSNLGSFDRASKPEKNRCRLLCARQMMMSVGSSPL
jgi:hypothetical protein